jgi:SAM-dependent methyltransferase
MKILYVGNFTQPHCTEVHLAATLRDMGHQVIEVQENGGDAAWLRERLTMHLHNMELFLFTRTWGDTVTLDHLEYLRNAGIPSASYHLDLYVGLQREDGLDNDPFWRTDFVFTPDGSEEAAKVFAAKGINHYYMKPGVFKPECYIAPQHLNNPVVAKDVVFVGGGSATGEGPQYGHKEWPYRGQLIKFLQHTFGPRFHKFGWPQATVRNRDLNHLYANSKVVVGDSLCLNFERPYYWSDRVYETIGRGGFIIHPYITGMEEEFTDQVNIVFYEYGNWGQLEDLINYYLEHDDQREAIRRAGHELVKNSATYHNRLMQMLDTIAEARQNIAAPTDEAIKISLGAGLEPEDGFVNLDIVDMPGVDVVHNLMHFPYPFQDNSAEYIKAKDLIEHLATHLPDGRNTLIAFIEECHRILKPGGTLWIQTPAWDADFLWIDPTHVRGYDIRSFDFFDPDTDFGRGTGFYSDVKFKVSAERTENGNLQFTMVKL